jgi:hypothetical protein
MVVLNAVRCNPWLRQHYERLRAAGKLARVAVIAAMRKLLAAVWSGVLTANPSFHIYLQSQRLPVTNSA